MRQELALLLRRNGRLGCPNAMHEPTQWPRQQQQQQQQWLQWPRPKGKTKRQIVPLRGQPGVLLLEHEDVEWALACNSWTEALC